MARAGRPSAGGRRATERARTSFFLQAARAARPLASGELPRLASSGSRHALGRPEGAVPPWGCAFWCRPPQALERVLKATHGSARPAVRERTAYAVSLCRGSTSRWLALRAPRQRRVRAKQGLFGHGSVVANSWSWHPKSPAPTSRLTLPSRGRPTGYALRPPLMSNVSRHEPRHGMSSQRR